MKATTIMRSIRRISGCLSALLMLAIFAPETQAQTPSVEQAKADSFARAMEARLGEVKIVKRRQGTRRLKGAENGTEIGRDELCRAACCNLGESFVTNPSVDVNYSDAAVGAKQIKLLGLSGTYVQMLTENMPNFRGAAMPFSLGYVPGPWMNSIQVSKGAANVKNGYESVTGQINVQYLDPAGEEGASVNLYGDSEQRYEVNADANVIINKKLSTEVLVHAENRYGNHDMNHDGFSDMPDVEQYNLQNRWKYNGHTYKFQGGFAFVGENRNSGQLPGFGPSRYTIGINTDRFEGYMKNALILDEDHNTNMALVTNFSQHNMDAHYGRRIYDVDQSTLYNSLMLETEVDELHSISLGLSQNLDYLHQRHRLGENHDVADPIVTDNIRDLTLGGYGQYTYTLGSKLTAMAGLRCDYSTFDKSTFLTPRAHVKWQPIDLISLRASVGKGYRHCFALAENHNLLASGRKVVINDLHREEATNYGLSSSLNIPFLKDYLKVNLEYYFTDFAHQAIVNYETPYEVSIDDLQGKSYSHTFQVDATMQPVKGLNLTAAYRYNIVRATYNGVLREKPLNNRYKALLTAGYKTPLGLWQADVTLQLNGGGRMPTSYCFDGGDIPAWGTRFHAYEQLSAQITRWFKHFSVYVGGENLTNFKQKNPIINAADPWSKEFDSGMVWGPISGAMVYAGVRINIGRIDKF